MKKKLKGFTMIELVVAVAIMGVIMIIAIPSIKYIQGSNKDTKYKAYEKAINAAAKAYVDTYYEDLFGQRNTGCAVIYYENLKEKDLIEDIQVKDSYCNNDSTDKSYTFTVVHKTKNNNYNYDTNVTCRDKNTKDVIYGKKSNIDLDNYCKLEDGQGPDARIKDYSSYATKKFYQKGQLPNIKVTIYDEGIGLKEDQELKYRWYKNGTAIGTEHTIKFRNKNYALTSIKPITNPSNMDNNTDDTLYQLVLSGTLEDVDNNSTTHTYVDKVWKFNVKYLGTDKCAGYIIQTPDGKDATASNWFNSSLKVGSKFNSNSIPELQDLNVSSYNIYQSINGAAYKELKKGVKNDGTLIDAGGSVEGTIKFKVSYMIDGLDAPIDCPSVTGNYNMDHKKPTVVSWTKGDITKASTYLYATGKANDGTGGSGIKYYAISTSTATPSSGWTDIGNKAANNTISIGVARISGTAAKYYYFVKDKAGNVTRSSNTVTQYKLCTYEAYMRDAAVYKMTFNSNSCGSKKKKMNIYNTKCYGYRDKYLNVYCRHTMTTKSSETNYGHSGNTTYIYYDSKDHCKQGISKANTYVTKICSDGKFKAESSHPERFIINHGGAGKEYQFHGFRFFTKACQNSLYCDFSKYINVWVHQPVTSAAGPYDASHTSSSATAACAKEFKSMSTNYDNYK